MRRSRLRQVSDIRTEMQYAQFVQNYLSWHKKCEVCPLIRTVDPLWSGCRGTPGGLHHLRKRSASGALTNPANVLASCSPGNLWVEDNPLLAHDAGLVVREGDPNWDVLGARYWRGK